MDRYDHEVVSDDVCDAHSEMFEDQFGQYLSFDDVFDMITKRKKSIDAEANVLIVSPNPKDQAQALTNYSISQELENLLEEIS
jgi:hypothetical protein